MAENLRASLRIGGPLTREQASIVLEALIERAKTRKISTKDLLNAFERALATNKPFDYEEYDAPNGVLPQIEAVLVAHRVPFERVSDPGSEFDGERRVFNGTELYTYPHNVDYDVVVRVIDVRRAHAGGFMEEFLERYRLIDFQVPPLATSPRKRIPIMAAIAELRADAAAGKLTYKKTDRVA